MDTVWTPELARERLKAEVAKVRNIRAPSYGPIITLDDAGNAKYSVFNAVKRIGRRDPDGGKKRRFAMLLWATQTSGVYCSEKSLTQLLKDMGWPKSSFDRDVNEGFEILALILSDAAENLRETLNFPLDTGFNRAGERTQPQQ